MKKRKTEINRIQSSFRDPSGFLFKKDGVLYRQVNRSYQENYDLLIQSGLYEALTQKGLLIPHQEVDSSLSQTHEAYKILKPEPVEFISYPYEWCFSQLKDAAQATLTIQEIALSKGMSLKDASAYNIQFHNGKPVFIDTLSFEKSNMEKPWIAYRQFCQHFLAPLALMSRTDTRLNQLMRVFIDGIPLDLASTLLPGRTKFSFSLLSHIHLHSRSQKSYADKQVKKKDQKISRLGYLGLMNSLKKTVGRLHYALPDTEWADYYNDTNYNDQAFSSKHGIISDYLDKIKPRMVWDLGANNGLFSRIASQKGISTISFDIDPAAVEKNYLQTKEKKEARILPLQMDLTNPSSPLGWSTDERMGFSQRGPVDLGMALALIHHLAIGNNVPLEQVASFFASICRNLIIEFVPKEDSQVQRLLASREDIFPHYHQKGFEEAFSAHFTRLDHRKVDKSSRILYLMTAIDAS